MHAFLDFLLKYGYWVLFFNILAEQLAIPFPTTPVFLAMGALAGLGNFSFPAAVALSVFAAGLADVVWYQMGLSRGTSILNLICRISLEPDSCVSNTKNRFRKWGAYSLLISKFVPGFNAAAAPLAGLSRIPLRRFLLFDLAGALLWSTTYLSIGYLLRNQLELAAERVSRYGGRVGLTAIGLLVLYLGYKYYQRQRFIRELRVARITPAELMELITSGEDVAIVDLRSMLEVEYEAKKLPGAIWIDSQDLERRHEEIPREKEVILYCS